MNNDEVRDRFAGIALAALLAERAASGPAVLHLAGGFMREAVAAKAYAWAEAMMVARDEAEDARRTS